MADALLEYRPVPIDSHLLVKKTNKSGTKSQKKEVYYAQWNKYLSLQKKQREQESMCDEWADIKMLEAKHVIEWKRKEKKLQERLRQLKQNFRDFERFWRGKWDES